MRPLLHCPFCAGAMRVQSNRDWHRLVGEHDADCVLTEVETVCPATDADLSELIAAWNKRGAVLPRYRLLTAQDRIEAGDEFLADDGVTWTKMSDGAHLFVGLPYRTGTFQPARRRITDQPEG